MLVYFTTSFLTTICEKSSPPRIFLTSSIDAQASIAYDRLEPN